MIVDQYARNEMKLCFAIFNLKRFTPSTNNSLSYFLKSLHIFMLPPFRFVNVLQVLAFYQHSITQ